MDARSALRLKWRRLPDMPEAMQWPHSVFADEAVYVTAGGGHRTCVIHSYKLQTLQWIQLPESGPKNIYFLTLPIVTRTAYSSSSKAPVGNPGNVHSKKERADTTCIRVLIECPRI